jgi:AcrR family transcriptional regulator
MSTAAVRNRRREQRENTKREILAAADRLLRERPYRELNVDLVMAQTGLTRTAFYRHFDDVPDLVLRLLEDVGGELYAIAERWRAGALADFPASGRDGLSGIVQFMVRHGKLVRAVADAAATDELIERGYRQFLDSFAAMINDGLEELVERGQLDVPDTRALAQALNLMNEAFLLDQFGQEPLGDPQIAVATLETIWLRVIAPGGDAAQAA